MATFLYFNLFAAWNLIPNENIELISLIDLNWEHSPALQKINKWYFWVTTESWTLWSDLHALQKSMDMIAGLSLVLTLSITRFKVKIFSGTWVLPKSVPTFSTPKVKLVELCLESFVQTAFNADIWYDWIQLCLKEF